jgi:hypothetical protein
LCSLDKFLRNAADDRYPVDVELLPPARPQSTGKVDRIAVRRDRQPAVKTDGGIIWTLFEVSSWRSQALIRCYGGRRPSFFRRARSRHENKAIGR